MVYVTYIEKHISESSFTKEKLIMGVENQSYSEAA
jgi:hypothetical protein